jgi:hypothetical protein
MTWQLPGTYHLAGHGRGTATLNLSTSGARKMRTSSCTIRYESSPRARALRVLSSWKNNRRGIRWPPQIPASRATHRSSGVRPAAWPASMTALGEVGQLAVVAPGPGGDHREPGGPQQEGAAGEDSGGAVGQAVRAGVGEVPWVGVVEVAVPPGWARTWPWMLGPYGGEVTTSAI